MKDAINQISGSTDSAFFLRSTSQPLECHLQQPTKWQPEAHLPRLPYPVRTGEYTRFRLTCRDPHEVFLAKVEEALSKHNKKMRAYKERIHKVNPLANQNP
nr:unnamed protein product [Spirometra erinaceieuropaei]